MQNIFRFAFNLFLFAVCGVLSTIAIIENYLQLVAAFSLLNTDAMPISADRGLPWLAALIPSDASLVEGMSMLMSLGFALGVFCTMRLFFQLPAFGMAILQTADREARRTLIMTAAQKAVLAIGLTVILLGVGTFEFELFTLRSIANAMGEDSSSKTVLTLAPWAQGAAEYTQSYALSLCRLLPRAYLGVVVIAAVLFEISIADLGDAWSECVGTAEEADTDHADVEETIDGAQDDDDAAMTDTVDATEPHAAVMSRSLQDAEPTVAVAAAAPPRDPARENATSGEIRFSTATAPLPRPSRALASPDTELVDIFGRPGQRISIANARLDPTLRVDVATRHVWDRAFEAALARP